MPSSWPIGGVPMPYGRANKKRASQLQKNSTSQPQMSRKQQPIQSALSPRRQKLLSPPITPTPRRSEEHTSELQSLMRISYAVFCLKKKTTHKPATQNKSRE